MIWLFGRPFEITAMRADYSNALKLFTMPVVIAVEIFFNLLFTASEHKHFTSSFTKTARLSPGGSYVDGIERWRD